MKHIVGFSGGIDSQACARWVLNRYPAEDVILMNSDAGGNEHPLTTAFVDDYARLVHPVVKVTAIAADIWDTPGYAERRGFESEAPLDFPTMMQIKGCPPSRMKQFCTDILKLRPQKRWLVRQFGPGGPYEGQAYARYSGKRRDESKKREMTPFQAWDDWFDCDTFAPLMDWTKQMCFDYVRAHGEAVNPLYALGFNRVGCAPCINSGREDILNWATRFPEMIDKLRAWEQQTGLTFFMPMEDGVTRNTIDDVVDWARSKPRRPKHRLLPMMHDRPSCESKFGLCE